MTRRKTELAAEIEKIALVEEGKKKVQLAVKELIEATNKYRKTSEKVPEMKGNASEYHNPMALEEENTYNLFGWNAEMRQKLKNLKAARKQLEAAGDEAGLSRPPRPKERTEETPFDDSLARARKTIGWGFMAGLGAAAFLGPGAFALIFGFAVFGASATVLYGAAKSVFRYFIPENTEKVPASYDPSAYNQAAYEAYKLERGLTADAKKGGPGVGPKKGPRATTGHDVDADEERTSVLGEDDDEDEMSMAAVSARRGMTPTHHRPFGNSPPATLRERELMQEVHELKGIVRDMQLRQASMESGLPFSGPPDRGNFMQPQPATRSRVTRQRSESIDALSDTDDDEVLRSRSDDVLRPPSGVMTLDRAVANRDRLFNELAVKGVGVIFDQESGQYSVTNRVLDEEQMELLERFKAADAVAKEAMIRNERRSPPPPPPPRSRLTEKSAMKQAQEEFRAAYRAFRDAGIGVTKFSEDDSKRPITSNAETAEQRKIFEDYQKAFDKLLEEGAKLAKQSKQASQEGPPETTVTDSSRRGVRRAVTSQSGQTPLQAAYARRKEAIKACQKAGLKIEYDDKTGKPVRATKTKSEFPKEDEAIAQEFFDAWNEVERFKSATARRQASSLPPTQTRERIEVDLEAAKARAQQYNKSGEIHKLDEAIDEIDKLKKQLEAFDKKNPTQGGKNAADTLRTGIISARRLDSSSTLDDTPPPPPPRERSEVQKELREAKERYKYLENTSVMRDEQTFKRRFNPKPDYVRSMSEQQEKIDRLEKELQQIDQSAAETSSTNRKKF